MPGSRELVAAVGDTVRPGRQDLAAPGRGDLAGVEAVDDVAIPDAVAAQGRADVGDDGPLLAERDFNLLAGGEHVSTILAAGATRGAVAIVAGVTSHGRGWNLDHEKLVLLREDRHLSHGHLPARR